MNDQQRAAMQMALEALEVSTDWDVGARGKQLQSMKAITALREALDHFADAGNKVSDHIADAGKVIMLTAEQAQQIEEALDELRYANNTDIAKTKYYKALSTIREARAQEQEPVPTGATHYQPHQKTYYKRVSATEWYLWSCTGKGWLPSKGTSDSSEWIMLSPIQAHQPAKPAEQEPVAWRVRGYSQFKTGNPALWRYVDGADKPAVNNPDCCDFTPLYAAPVRTKDLTDDEIYDVCKDIPFVVIGPDYDLAIARAVIAADREKNK